MSQNESMSQGNGDFDSRGKTPNPLSSEPSTGVANPQEAERKQKERPRASVLPRARSSNLSW
jgi:hypothetical protein